MAQDRSTKSSFPVRFANERTRELLRAVALHEQVSMNKLAEEMIERELEVMALGIEDTLSRTIEILRSYRGEGRSESWARFAEAEGFAEPVLTHRTHRNHDDPYGVARAFEAGG
jgi:hypothetical protein